MSFNDLRDIPGISAVPAVAQGRFRIEELTRILDAPSAYSTSSLREGIYLRQENQDWLIQRAKLVRPEFVQHIGDHWSSGPLVRNRITPCP